jgi:DNA-directed RNA polymerase alpha subunit
MKVKKLGGKDNVLELEFTDASPAYMNTIRRAVMNDVPTLAIEVVEVRKNTSVMYDEMLCLRMGLLPLTTPVGDYALPSAEEMETQEFSAKSSIVATLTAVGPCTVYAKDIKFKDSKVKAVYPDTPLVKLLEGQEVELEAKVVLGTGKTHAKWSPGLVYYHEIPKFKGKSLPVADEQGQVAAGAWDNIDESSKDYEPRTGHFYMKVEGWGQLKPQDMLTLAFDSLNTSLKEFDALVKAA